MDEVLRIQRIVGSAGMNAETLRASLLHAPCHGMVGCQNWEEHRIDDHLVSVRFFLGYEDMRLLCLFQVSEQEIRAVNTVHQSPVYQDSCVELFISDVQGLRYTNLEFNPLGTCLAYTGPDRKTRQPLGESFFSRLQVHASYRQALTYGLRSDDGHWELLLGIPTDALGLEGFPAEGDLSGTEARINLYKCGDLLRMRHYLSWKPIRTALPDFHRPEFFGRMVFMP